MPRELVVPLFPLREVVLFPCVSLPLYVFEPRYRTMLADVLDSSGLLAVAMPAAGFEAGEGAQPPLCPVMGVGRVVDYDTQEDGSSHIHLRGHYRARLLEELPSSVYRRARLELLPEQRSSGAASGPLRLALAERMKRIQRLALRSEIRDFLGALQTDEGCDLQQLVGLLATILVPAPGVRQNLLETGDVLERGRHLLNILDTLLQELAADTRSAQEEE